MPDLQVLSANTDTQATWCPCARPSAARMDMYPPARGIAAGARARRGRPRAQQPVVGACGAVERVQVGAGDERERARQLLALPVPVPAQQLVRRGPLARTAPAARRACARTAHDLTGRTEHTARLPPRALQHLRRQRLGACAGRAHRRRQGRPAPPRAPPPPPRSTARRGRRRMRAARCGGWRRRLRARRRRRRRPPPPLAPTRTGTAPTDWSTGRRPGGAARCCRGAQTPCARSLELL